MIIGTVKFKLGHSPSSFAPLQISNNGIGRFYTMSFQSHLTRYHVRGIHERALSALNTHLVSNTYMVGHSVTLANIIMTCNLVMGFSRIMTKSFTSEFPRILGEMKQAESVPLVQSSKRPSQPEEPKHND
ncbi:hypothetical protein VitviT2T_005632 [Vitis vinifera]|uniref:GST C-terminal domain-containing protein n=1 Tax=Vitis vinifera TaxID=29760 RepID=A0ABY9BT55_VITVI|nr:hypothetical protein VitviT2T_005632 [Vitis vinifera]